MGGMEKEEGLGKKIFVLFLFFPFFSNVYLPTTRERSCALDTQLPCSIDRERRSTLLEGQISPGVATESFLRFAEKTFVAGKVLRSGRNFDRRLLKIPLFRAEKVVRDLRKASRVV